VLSRDLVQRLAPQIAALAQARPLGASVEHAIRFLKYEVSVTPVESSESEVSTGDGQLCMRQLIAICRHAHTSSPPSTTSSATASRTPHAPLPRASPQTEFAQRARWCSRLAAAPSSRRRCSRRSGRAAASR
jgi:translation initiation factor 2B subunit (eIF-2B alpha/beta/delta family)